jgi:Ca2+-dependent lipid-binding protein
MLMLGGFECLAAKVQLTVSQYRPSELRKLQDSLADPKYEGVRTSRKALEERQYEESEIDSEDEEDEFAGLHGGSSDVDRDGEEPDNSEGDESQMNEDEDSEGDSEDVTDEAPPSSLRPPKRPAPEQEEDPTSALKQAREADKKKGQAVAKQIVSQVLCRVHIPLAHTCVRHYGIHSWIHGSKSKRL